MEPLTDPQAAALKEQEIRTTKLKRQIQLAVLAFLAAIALHFFNFHFPMKSELNALQRSNDILEKQINSMSRELRELNATSAVSEKERAQQALSERMLATVPRSPMVYCPLRINELMKKANVQKTRSTLQVLLPYPNTQGLIKQSWKIEVPAADALSLGTVIAELENTFPLAQLTSVAIKKNPNPPGVNAEVMVQFAVQP